MDNLDWYTAEEMAEIEGVDRSTILRRAGKGRYQVQENDGRKYYAKNEGAEIATTKSSTPKPEKTHDVDKELCRYTPDENDFNVCPNCQMPIGITQEVARTIERNTIYRIEAKTAMLQGLVTDAVKVQQMAKDLEEQAEEIRKTQDELEVKAKDLSQRENLVKTSEQQLSGSISEQRQLEADLAKREKALKNKEAEFNTLLPEIEDKEIKKRQENFADFAYSQYWNASKMNVVIPIGYRVYNGKYGLTKNQAMNAWLAKTDSWGENTEIHRGRIQIN